MPKTSPKSKRILKYFTISIVVLFALYSGGLIDAFAGFLRTGGWKKFLPVSNPNSIEYGYGFGDNGWGFGTGFGLATTGYTESTIATAPKYNSGNIVALQSNQKWAAPVTAITGTSTTPQEVVLPKSGLTTTVISVATGTTAEVKLNVNNLITQSGNTKEAILPAITLDTSVADVQIPASTRVTGTSAWTGVISAPRITTVSLPTTNNVVREVQKAVQVGFAGVNLIFSNPVKLTIPGQAGKLAGYIPEGGSFVEITTVCNSAVSPTNIVGNGECKIDVGADMVIFTKHFTKFVSFTSSTSSSGGGGGSSYAGGGSFHLVMDKCPKGDYSPSYYDRTCGVVPAKGATSASGSKATKDDVVDEFISIIKDGGITEEGTGSTDEQTIDMGKTQSDGFFITYTAPNGKVYTINKIDSGYAFKTVKGDSMSFSTFGDAVNYIYSKNQVLKPTIPTTAKKIIVAKPKKLVNTPIKPKPLVKTKSKTKSKSKTKVAKERTIVHVAPNKKVYVIREVNNKCYNIGLEKTAFGSLIEALQYIDKTNK